MSKWEKERQLMERLHQEQIAAREHELAKALRDAELLGSENERLARRVEQLERQEASVLEAIVHARSSASETVEKAQLQAREIYENAIDVTNSARDISDNARSIIAQAQEHAAEIMERAHGESNAILQKANEHAAFVQSEARLKFEEYQSLLENARSRMHSLMLSSVENMRDFAVKLSTLYSEGVPNDLEPLLAESIRDIELRLKQIGAPPADPNQPAIGYTNPDELMKALHRMQGLSSEAVSGTRQPDEERVWTVDEVMRQSGEAARTGFDRLGPDAPPPAPMPPAAAVPPPPPPPPAAAVPPAAAPPTMEFANLFEDLPHEVYSSSTLGKDSEVGVERFEGLNLRDSSNHSRIERADNALSEYVKPDSLVGAPKEQAFEGLQLRNSPSGLISAPREEAFFGLNLRQGGHSILEPGADSSKEAKADKIKVELRRTKERESLPSDFIIR